MSKVRWGVLGLAGATVAAAGVWSLRGDAPMTGVPTTTVAEVRTGPPADLEQEVRALRAELEALRRTQGRLEQHPHAAPVLPVGNAAGKQEEDAEGQDAKPTEEAQRAAQEQRRQERVMELDAELEAAANTEPRDAQWASPTESLVTQSFQGPDFVGSRLARVECRTHLCTLEVEHDDGEAQAELLTSLSRVKGLRGQTVVRPRNEGGRRTSRVYLSRAGERLPLTPRK
ncbi:hypothetical protein [Myxococcus qinghaiensis]|uniref:hypothetical protein n=1 Tax=Myxococcus qinghaiensis TaxID=2906758 RepID=UPI0020A789AD|nr:hypothetical protein [Myxococcus qinghaiensis]MCP3165044.1 hypothetical protein [Myxococcus qinghaiensis]